jgi:hypothetical protein
MKSRSTMLKPCLHPFLDPSAINPRNPVAVHFRLKQRRTEAAGSLGDLCVWTETFYFEGGQWLRKQG